MVAKDNLYETRLDIKLVTCQKLEKKKSDGALIYIMIDIHHLDAIMKEWFDKVTLTIPDNS